jgi:hypothetical protein
VGTEESGPVLLRKNAIPTRRRGNAMLVSWGLVMVGLKGCRTGTKKELKPSAHKSM